MAVTEAPPTMNRLGPSAYERRKVRADAIARRVMLAAALALAVPVLLIIGVIVWRAVPVLSLDYLWLNPIDKGKAGGLWGPLVGTLALVVISVLLAAPVGVAAGIYLNEYARDGMARRVITLAMTSLAGVPSIVNALFGLGAFVLFARMGASMLAASCTLAVMNLPVIIASAQQALAAVPMPFREACWNLGASRWQTIRTIVLPNSLAGILTGVILAVSRAAGETAPILFTGAVFFEPIPDHGVEKLVPYGLGDQFMALSMHLHVISTQVSGMPEASMFGCAFVLVALVLAINSVAIMLRLRLRRRRRW